MQAALCDVIGREAQYQSHSAVFNLYSVCGWIPHIECEVREGTVINLEIVNVKLWMGNKLIRSANA